MTGVSTTLEVSYLQISLFRSQIQDPFNDWSDRHYEQGFAWRDGSVGFRCLDDGPIEITVVVGRTDEAPGAIRVIEVPFRMDETGRGKVATISNGLAFDLLPGEYKVTFAHGAEAESGMWCRLFLERVQTPPSPRVMVFDEPIDLSLPLAMDAIPAT